MTRLNIWTMIMMVMTVALVALVGQNKVNAQQLMVCPFTCSGRGTCLIRNNVAACSCQGGYTGYNCQFGVAAPTPAPPVVNCPGQPCANGGLCKSNLCYCPQTYTGTYCETPMPGAAAGTGTGTAVGTGTGTAVGAMPVACDGAALCSGSTCLTINGSPVCLCPGNTNPKDCSAILPQRSCSTAEEIVCYPTGTTAMNQGVACNVVYDSTNKPSIQCECNGLFTGLQCETAV